MTDTPARATPLSAAPAQRIAWIDRARGVALIAMIVYHFSFDLSFLGIVDWPVGGHPLWRGFAMAIAGSFIALAGLSLAIAAQGGLRWRPYLRRLLRIAAAAAVVTVATWAAMPWPVWFGILHAIATFSVLALPFVLLPARIGAPAAALAGIVVFAGQWLFVSPIFASPWLTPLGLSPTPLPSFDYEPIFPWFALMLLGVALAPVVPLRRGPVAGDPVARMGRNSLAIYLLHQPILLGLLIAAQRIGLI
ncbi:DUF1624 domain-containing protein [Palleronia sediminis]|uniref:DUF1624 domain-containing protein n=1 Tax=Palleronia sediminis TaxID=2547833 RepID=A0A4R6ADK4_9RHOB|nr:heparan-alpha-glucosaminide N-acetyltransferase [Palleronia sediminis]TDL81930.1 DUF1624 domain-containing protein [Palleronia sediminis]